MTKPALPDSLHHWKLEDAKARFSELVQLARTENPQLITVRGEEAVVVLSAQLFAKVLPWLSQPSLHGLFSQSPLSRLNFETQSIKSPVRAVEF